MVGKHENEHYTSFSPGTSTSNLMLYKVTIEKLIVLTYYPVIHFESDKNQRRKEVSLEK